jgi:hypothetical protein
MHQAETRRCGSSLAETGRRDSGDSDADAARGDAMAPVDSEKAV